MSIAAVFAGDKVRAADKETPFRAEPADTYKHHQTNEKVTIGVDPYDAGEKIKVAFGKLDPYQHGVLPVLVVIQNDSTESIRLDRLQAVYVGSANNRVEATPAKDVKFLNGPREPKGVPGAPGGIKIGKSKKNPLDVWEIEGRSFAAQMLPPGQSASGFFYFQTGLQHGSTIYLSGMTAAKSGKELFYFEVPLL